MRVSGPLMLYLEHDPLVRLIGDRQGFGNHPVETCSLEFLEPPLRGREVGARRGEVNRGPRVGQGLFECGAALGERSPGVILVVQSE